MTLPGACEKKMRDKETVENVAAVFKLRFARGAEPVCPSAEWRSRLDAELAEIRPEPLADSPFVRYEKQIWRAGWISFAASMAALLLFGLVNVWSLRQSTVDETLSNLYGNIIIESGF